MWTCFAYVEHTKQFSRARSDTVYLYIYTYWMILQMVILVCALSPSVWHIIRTCRTFFFQKWSVTITTCAFWRSYSSRLTYGPKTIYTTMRRRKNSVSPKRPIIDRVQLRIVIFFFSQHVKNVSSQRSEPERLRKRSDRRSQTVLGQR